MAEHVPLTTHVKQRMIEQMAMLLATRGLQSASFAEVLDAAGAPRGSVYHHFPGGKDELVIAAIEFTARRAFEFLDSLKGRTGVEVTQAFLSAWRTLLNATSLKTGCAVLAVTVGMGDSPGLRMKTGEIFKTWRERLAERLHEGGVPADKAEGLAASLIAASEGAVALSRAEGSLHPFDLMAAEMTAVVAATVGAEQPRRPAGAPAGTGRRR
jgi:TetR/AcrR family transcriptional repressor of lmrAB and yxaGH operons